MVSVVSQLIEEDTAHVQSDSLEDARKISAEGTYFPNNLCIHIFRFPPRVLPKLWSSGGFTRHFILGL